MRRASRRSRPRQRKEREPVRILCVDDDPQTLRYVRDALTRAGYAPVVTGDPEEVPRLMAEEPPNLVLLDLVLPGSDGIELMQQIRETADVPVIFLSAYGQDEVIARAFDLGAADYVVKPFSPTELAARIRAALRKRAAPELAEPARPYVRGELTVDYALRRVTVAGNPVALTIIEYRMLVELSANAGRPLTHEHLLQRVWGPDKGEDSGPVRNIVRRLRRKLGDDPGNPAYIFAEPSVGYRMAEGKRGNGERRERRQKGWPATAFADGRGVAPDRMSLQPALGWRLMGATGVVGPTPYYQDYQELPAKLAGLSDGQWFMFLGSISPRNAGGFELPVPGGQTRPLSPWAVERRRDPVPAPHCDRAGHRPGQRPLQGGREHGQRSCSGPEVLPAPRRLAHHQQRQRPARSGHPAVGSQLVLHLAGGHRLSLELDVVSSPPPGSLRSPAPAGRAAPGSGWAR